MIFSHLLNMQSHPSWVCGLKPRCSNLISYALRSHPSWVCGLKLSRSSSTDNGGWSHPSWVCGLKLRRLRRLRRLRSHTLRGCVDWNKMLCVCWTCSASHTLRGCVDWNFGVKLKSIWTLRSHPSWVCGLKPRGSHIQWETIKSHPSWVCGLKQVIC